MLISLTKSSNVISYDVFPIDFSPERAEIISDLMRKIAVTDNVFSDYTGTCEVECVALALPLEHMCTACRRRMGIIAQTLTAPTSRTWEVWRSDEEPMLVGVVSLTDIEAAIDAKAHYIFFDGRLADKTPIIQDLIAWTFEDHEGWEALARLTIEIPKPFCSLARHASRKLGFGGDFRYKVLEGRAKREPEFIRVEGVKRAAVKWKGAQHDLLVLGLTRVDVRRAQEAPRVVQALPEASLALATQP